MGDFLWQSHTGTVLPSNVRTTPTGKPGQPGAPKIPNARLSQESSAVELARSLLRIVADVNSVVGLLWNGIPFFGGRFFDSDPESLPLRVPLVVGVLRPDGTRALRLKHGLGRPYQGWFLCGQSDAAHVWEVVDDSEGSQAERSGDSSQVLVLASDAPTKIRVFVF